MNMPKKIIHVPDATVPFSAPLTADMHRKIISKCKTEDEFVTTVKHFPLLRSTISYIEKSLLTSRQLYFQGLTLVDVIILSNRCQPCQQFSGALVINQHIITTTPT